jgi:hypothetical protein
MVGIRGGAEEKKGTMRFLKKLLVTACGLENRQKKPCILLPILARTKVLKELRRLQKSLLAD